MNLFQNVPRAFHEVIEKKLLPPKPAFTPEELEHFGAWSLLSKVKLEGSRPNFKDFPFQPELYNESRSSLRQRVVIMKAAQVGLTVKFLMRGMWLTADANRQINVGLMFPTADGVQKMSASRFRPMLNSSARMLELLSGVDTVDLMRIGISSMRFLGVMASISQESNPLDALLVDEVRRMPIRTVENLMVRISESTLRGPDGTRGLIELNSTAGEPNRTIHRYFLESTQGYWSNRCPDVKCLNNRVSIILPLEFAAEHTRVIGQEDSGWYYLKCPRCGARIRDYDLPDGFYHELEPGAQWKGFHVSQLVKGEGLLNSDIMAAFNRGLNVPEFHNSRLGLPYHDPNAQPASRGVVELCMDPNDNYRWPEAPLGFDASWRAMGIDQRAPEKHYVIKTLMSNGLHRTDKVGVLEKSGGEAALELACIAHAWGCKIVVIDGEPSYDLAVDVARFLPKGVTWLQDYVSSAEKMVSWVDKHKDATVKKASGETKYPLRVLVDRSKGLDWSLRRFVLRTNLLPCKSSFYGKLEARTLGGHTVGASLGEEYISHLGQLYKYQHQAYERGPFGEQVPVPGGTVQRWGYTEYDPHFAHANLYADVGLSRMQKNPEHGALDTDPQPNLPASLTLPQIDPFAGSCLHARKDQPCSCVYHEG